MRFINTPGADMETAQFAGTLSVDPRDLTGLTPDTRLSASLQSRPDQLRPILQGLTVVFWECGKVTCSSARVARTSHPSQGWRAYFQARLSSELFLQAVAQLEMSPECQQELAQVLPPEPRISPPSLSRLLALVLVLCRKSSSNHAKHLGVWNVPSGVRQPGLANRHGARTEDGPARRYPDLHATTGAQGD